MDLIVFQSIGQEQENIQFFFHKICTITNLVDVL